MNGVHPVQVTQGSMDISDNITHRKPYYFIGEIFGSSPYHGANQDSDADRPLLSKSNAMFGVRECRSSANSGAWT